MVEIVKGSMDQQVCAESLVKLSRFPMREFRLQ